MFYRPCLLWFYYSISRHKSQATRCCSRTFFFVYCGAKFVLQKGLTFGADRVTIQTTKTPRMRRTAFGVFCLTTVYPTSTHGAHGNSGGKSAGKDALPSGKGRKCLKLSGNRYSQILWEQDVAGSSPITSNIIAVSTANPNRRDNLAVFAFLRSAL